MTKKNDPEPYKVKCTPYVILATLSLKCQSISLNRSLVTGHFEKSAQNDPKCPWTLQGQTYPIIQGWGQFLSTNYNSTQLIFEQFQIQFQLLLSNSKSNSNYFWAISIPITSDHFNFNVHGHSFLSNAAESMERLRE